MAVMRILEDLQTIEKLCRKYGRDDRANDVEQQSALFEKDRKLFWSKFVSLTWWGGSGSMADMELYAEDGSIADGERKKDNRSYRSTLISIYEQMVGAGHEYAQAKSWIDTFRVWERNGI